MGWRYTYWATFPKDERAHYLAHNDLEREIETYSHCQAELEKEGMSLEDWMRLPSSQKETRVEHIEMMRSKPRG